MTDDIYFEETFAFTCERLRKNGIDPETFFHNKVVIDAGCGSGKFSATIARLEQKSLRCRYWCKGTGVCTITKQKKLIMAKI